MREESAIVFGNGLNKEMIMSDARRVYLRREITTPNMIGQEPGRFNRIVVDFLGE
jgi:hypothetical protein